MLDQETKRRIDSCRNMLVGKIPDPKSQVEQITIGLIYKFMDDMDNEAVEMGGKASFFTGDYAKYSWTAIFDPRIGGHDLLKLYGEALEKMNQNPNIPQLFRNIFNNAYLPYRDPETLKLFLKEIDNFSYSHSEKLGDAFEYLLSFMGTQGDAGQFRTPRHIIDFIAEVVDPKKNETVLDPACGTAGFMVSAYKHILKNNDGGKKLTPDERKRLINNFIGYDISPDMVRLSLVNLYLHGFQDPKIYEYDTLTSEERWDDTVDVVLANPPFMTPKGGIRPHKRFAVQANRSEVLFVDYIAEHLNPGGRAGIIVPEGIIFQSNNAYKALRKMLIDDYLWAVVSLPAGVFNPYSGVKTSILLLDKRKSKESDSILFVKIDNDGFDLGAQRRTIDKNDLPEALKILQTGDVDNTEVAHWVEKSKIEESGDWNLSGERYRVSDELRILNYEMVALGEISKVSAGNSAPQGKEYFENGVMPFVRTSDVGKVHISNDLRTANDYVNQKAIDEKRLKLFSKGTILFPKSGASTFLNHRVMLGVDSFVSSHLATIDANKDKIIPKFLFQLLCCINAKSLTENQNYPSLRLKDIESIKVPLPPLSVQEEIVAEIDGYQKIIDGARQVVENYKPTIKIDSDWDMVKLEKVCDVRDGTHDSPKYQLEGYPLITSKNVKDGEINFSNVNLISEDDLNKINKRSKVDNGDIIMPMIGTIGNPIVVKKDREFGIKNVALIKFYDDSKVDNHFLKVMLDSRIFATQYAQFARGATQKFISLKFIRGLQIPLPPISIQKEIVSQIEAEQEMVAGNKKLIEIYEQKVKDKIGEVWGEE